ncbi:MAG: tetratricopeptide repeat protein [Mariprofundaceae bacterium]
MSEKNQQNQPTEAPLDAEMAELKRDMRSAQLTAWLEANTQSLIAGVIALVIVLIGGGLWIEHSKTERASAATVYQQALGEKDADKKVALLKKVVSDFSGSSYATMAEMLMANFDDKHSEAHLQAVIHASNAMQEWVWQARLDLAELKLQAGDKAAARSVLEEQVGKQYEQLRQYLLAEASDDVAEQQMHLQKALDAPSLDNDLKSKIESMLSGSASDNVVKAS